MAPAVLVAAMREPLLDEVTGTGIVKAAERGDEAVVRTALSGGVKADATYATSDGKTTGVTLLMLAAALGHEAIVETLLEHGATVDMQDSKGITALLYAAIKGCVPIVKRLLQQGADIDLPDSLFGRTALMFAALFNRPKVVRYLLKRGADPEKRNIDGETALELATEKGSKESAWVLEDNVLSRGGGSTGQGATTGEGDVVAEAATRGDEAAVRESLDGGGQKINATFNDGSASGLTLLMIASQWGHADMVDCLIRRGATVDLQDSEGRTALMAAATKGHRRIVETLLDHSAEVDLENTSGGTALMTAATKGHEHIVHTLLERGAAVAHRASDGATALMNAAYYNHPGTVCCLLQAGAKMDWRDEDDRTALSMANRRGHTACVEIFKEHLKGLTGDESARNLADEAEAEERRAEAEKKAAADSAEERQKAAARRAEAEGRDIVTKTIPNDVVSAVRRGKEADEEKTLAWVESGGQINEGFVDGEAAGVTLLMVATIYGHERLVDTLLERGASVDQQNENGFTALMYAAHTGHEGLVDKLLKAGAEVDRRPHDGGTALFLAVMFDRPAVVRLLLAAGADPEARNSRGKTALQMAKSLPKNKCGAAAVLKEHLAALNVSREVEAARCGEALLAEIEAEAAAAQAKESKKAKKKKKKGKGGGSDAAGPSAEAPEVTPASSTEAEAAAGTTVEEAAPASPLGPPTAVSLADVSFDTGRPAVPESTLGGETTCIVCFTRPKSHVAAPCGHLCACGSCSDKMQQCPICREPVLMWMQMRVA